VKILVSGPRDWPDDETGVAIIENALASVLLDSNPPHPFPWGLVVGDARGVDTIVRKIWTEAGHSYTLFAADWSGPCKRTCPPGHRRLHKGRRGMVGGQDYCPAAGVYRNQRMVEEKPDICVCFVLGDNLAAHRGTADTAKRAKKADIPVIVCTYTGQRYVL
jgi:hypothetical protein